MMRPRLEIALAASLLFAALALRLWYGAFEPTPSRFWDERYSLDNVRPVYADASVAPVSGYYPSPLVSVPPAVALWLAESSATVAGRPWRALDESSGLFAPAAYRIMRGLQAVYGVLGVALVLIIGRRMFNAQVGLLAAALLAFMPWHVHASGYIKPDAQLVAMILLAFLAALAAIERPTFGRHALAGVAVALAASAKLTGVVIAIALAVASAMLARREPRRLLLAGFAGLVAFVTFVLANPYWQGYLQLIRGLQRDYAMRGEAGAMSRWQIPAKLIEQLLAGYGLGPLAGTLALGGLSALAYATITGRGAGGTRRVRFAMLLAFPAAYTAVYAYSTAYYKGNNFLPVLPFAALAGSWALVALAERVPRPRAALAGAAILVVGMAAASATRYVYRSITPATFDHASSFLHRNLGRKLGRLIFIAGWQELEPPWERRYVVGGGEALVYRVARLDDVDAGRLAMADGIVLPAAALAAIEADPNRPLSRWLASAGDFQIERLSARGMGVRGPELVAIARRWRPLNRAGEAPVGQPCPSAPQDPACRRFSAGESLAPGEAWTFVIVPGEDTRQATSSLDIGGRAVRLEPTPQGFWLSERLAAPAPAVDIRLPGSWSEAAQRGASIECLRWRPPAPRRPSGH